MEANPDLFHRPPARAATGRNGTGGPGSTRIRPLPAASAPRPSALATGRRLQIGRASCRERVCQYV